MIVVVNLKRVDAGAYDEVWAIVRSAKWIKPGCQHRPELSPSWELFGWYRQCVKDGRWGTEAFAEYEKRFRSEMKAQSARNALNELWLKSKRGKKIAIGCFCDDYSLCHRSIIAEMLKGAGSDVHIADKREMDMPF